MEITRGSLLAGAQAARGLSVVIDVFRAFSCAPLLFSMGVEKGILVSTPEEAIALKKEDAALVLLGEVDGAPIEGFDFGNSPSQILKQDPAFFTGKTIVQRTSSGVQGALAALENSDEVLLASFALAASTARYIRKKNPAHVSILAMGWNLEVIAPEDEWCATYITHLLGKGAYNHIQALREIIFHEQAQKFLQRKKLHFPPEDPLLCLQRDVYDFVLRAERESGKVIVRKVMNEPSDSA
jgi:2-phosphosulfolactate phosphatase